MAFGLQLTDIYTSCHTFGCHNQATFFLGHHDSPNGTVYYVCDQCAGELKKQIIEATFKAEESEPLPFEDEPETEEIEVKSFEEMTVAELKSFAEGLHLTGLSKKTKAELIELIDKELDEGAE